MSPEAALEKARTPGQATCPECGGKFFAPMDKLSIALYNKCTFHLDDDGYQEHNLFTLIDLL